MIKRNQIFVAVALLLSAYLLSACDSDSSEIKKIVKDRLRDPDSARFGDLIISDDKRRACIEVTAKNTFGGYGDGQVAIAIKENGKWSVKKITDPLDAYFSCGDKGFALQDQLEKLGTINKNLESRSETD